MPKTLRGITQHSHPFINNHDTLIKKSNQTSCCSIQHSEKSSTQATQKQHAQPMKKEEKKQKP